MFIPKILTLFLSSAVVGAASSDVHSPITLNTDEDVVVSSPNLRSLATTERELVPFKKDKVKNNNKKKGKDTDKEGSSGTLSFGLAVENIPSKLDLGELKTILKGLVAGVLGVEDADVSVDEDEGEGDGRALQSTSDIIILKFSIAVNEILSDCILCDPNLSSFGSRPICLPDPVCVCEEAKSRLASLANAVDLWGKLIR